MALALLGCSPLAFGQIVVPALLGLVCIVSTTVALTTSCIRDPGAALPTRQTIFGAAL